MQELQFRTGVIQPVESFKEGLELIKRDYWILFAMTLVAGLLSGFTIYILGGAMFCGLFYSYIKSIDGQRVQFDDLWKGMNWFMPGLVVILFIVVPLIAFYFFTYVSLVAAIVAGAQAGDKAIIGAMVVVGIVDLVIVIAMTCFHMLIMFAFPLLVDRGLGPLAAMKLSARAVWANLGGVAGLFGVAFLISIVSYLALCVGLYFAIPIIIAGNVAAYRRVFPSNNGMNGQFGRS